MKQSRIVIIGPGAWGSALESCLKANGHESLSLDAKSRARDWNQAFSRPSYALLSCPFSVVRNQIEHLSHYPKLKGVINASKGIDEKSLQSFTGLARDLHCPTASLSGPSFARELQERKPTACVVASKQRSFSRKVIELFSTDWFRLYSHNDPLGVEACATLKNVMAIACGISDALGLGSNARAALLTRALVEMSVLVKVMGGKPATVMGLAGVGDLWLTATGDLSRNRRFGLAIGKGQSAQKALQTLVRVEGLYSLKQVDRLRKKYRLSLPISEAVKKIVDGKSKPQEEIKALMTRDFKLEESSRWKLS